MIIESFARKCFGARGQGVVRSLVIAAIVYGALRASDWQLQVAPAVLGLMAGGFSGGVMVRALMAKDNGRELRHLLMLPLDARALARGYVGVMAAYTLLTKTLPLLALLLALTQWSGGMFALVLAAALNGVLLAALWIGWRRRGWALVGWVVAVVALVMCEGERALPALVLSAGAALFFTAQLEAEVFLQQSAAGLGKRRSAERFLMLRYFLRYLFSHRNYLVNTVALWGVAAVLPFFLAPFAEDLQVAPLGFALLSLNTPLGILLSCDPALECAVRTLPAGLRMFCLPYGALLAVVFLLTEGVFLVSWQLQVGGVNGWMLAAAVAFALQSALATVWLEGRHPLRDWRMESDLWHHPRKYVVPAVMLVLAVAVGSQPWLLALLWMALACELGLLLRR